MSTQGVGGQEKPKPCERFLTQTPNYILPYNNLLVFNSKMSMIAQDFQTKFSQIDTYSKKNIMLLNWLL